MKRKYPFAIIEQLVKELAGEDMNEKINVLGVNIDSFTAKEAMKETIAFLESEPVSVIDVVSVDALMQMNDLPRGLAAEELNINSKALLLHVDRLDYTNRICPCSSDYLDCVALLVVHDYFLSLDSQRSHLRICKRHRLVMVDCCCSFLGHVFPRN